MKADTRRSWIGLILLLAVVLPVDLYRIAIPQSLWIDEIYSIQMANAPLGRMIELTALDRHPPGYYLLFRGWLRGGKAFGIEPGIFYGRLLNTALLAGFAALVWVCCRRLLGLPAGTVAAWCLVGSAQVLQSAKDMRGYMLGLAAVTACFLLMMILDGEEPKDRRQVRRLWLGYGAAAVVALWTHLLPALILAMLGVIWLARIALRRAWKSPSFRWGLGVQAAAAVSFLPWLLFIQHQFRSLSHGTDWMTPATWKNLWYVFEFWYPFGRIGDAQPWEKWWPAHVLGILTIAVPMGLALAGGFLTVKKRVALPLTAWVGLCVAVLNVVLQWGLDYLEIAPIFHGPRYPVFSIGLWMIGLVALASWGIERMGARPGWVWIAAIPLLGAAVFGQIEKIPHESNEGGLQTWRRESGELFPKTGEVVFFMPRELLPYFKPALRDFEVRPVEDLADLPGSVQEITIVQASLWQDMEKLHERLLRSVAQDGKLATQTDGGYFPIRAEEYAVFRLRGFHHEVARKILAGEPLSGEVPGDAISAGSPASQSNFDGWSSLGGDAFALFRWGEKSPVRLRFDRPVPAGRYKLAVSLHRLPYPTEEVTMEFQARGEDRALSIRVPSGGIYRELEIQLTRDHDPLVLEVSHPLWKPIEWMEGSHDTRNLTFMLYDAWVRPAEN